MKYDLTLQEVLDAARDARKRVSAMSPKQKAELLKRARKKLGTKRN